MAHVPVMAGEVLELIGARPGMLLVDLTVGAGGHSGAFLEATAPTGKVLASDRDVSACKLAATRLAADAERIEFTHADSVTRLGQLIEAGVRPDAVLLDLGVSSMQLDQVDRGFSLRADGPLDMRMDSSQGPTAANLVNRLGLDQLATVLRDFGDEPRAERIASAIVARRKARPFRSTGDLRDLVEREAGRGRGKIHPATRTFQALRMAVNRELELLAECLPLAARLLAPEGRLAVLAFHSGEDRMVKQAFAAAEAAGWGSRVNRKAVQASREEQRANRRSRSARLRVLTILEAPPVDGQPGSEEAR